MKKSRSDIIEQVVVTIVIIVVALLMMTVAMFAMLTVVLMSGTGITITKLYIIGALSIAGVTAYIWKEQSKTTESDVI